VSAAVEPPMCLKCGQPLAAVYGHDGSRDTRPKRIGLACQKCSFGLGHSFQAPPPRVAEPNVAPPASPSIEDRLAKAIEIATVELCWSDEERAEDMLANDSNTVGIFVLPSRHFLRGDVVIANFTNGQAKRTRVYGWSSKYRAPVVNLMVQYQRWRGERAIHCDPLRLRLDEPGATDGYSTAAQAAAVGWLVATETACAVGHRSGALLSRGGAP